MADYEIPGQQDDEENEGSSLSGQGWDILAGGKENPFKLGGDDPFDLVTEENPNPYSDDDETDWILTGGDRPEVIPEADPGDALPMPDESAASIAPSVSRDFEPPLPASTPSMSGLAMGLSPGVSVTPVGPGNRPETPEPVDTLPASAPPPVISGADDPLPPEVLAEPQTPALEAPPVTPDETPVGRDFEPPLEAESPLPDFSTETEVEAGPLPPDFSFPEPEVPTETEMGGEVPSPPGDFGPMMGEPLPSPSIPPVSEEPPWPVPHAQAVPGSSFVDPFRQPVIQIVEEDEELPPRDDYAQRLITDERVDDLWDEIKETYEYVVSDVRGHFGSTDQSLASLKKARELLLAGPEYYDNAEELVYEVKARLRLDAKVREWTRTHGTWLGIYMVVWLGILSVGSLFTLRVTELAINFVPSWLAATWLPGLFGGLGGVIAGLWVLIKHTARRRDFDPIHSFWYVLNPFMGIALGVLAYFLLLGTSALATNMTGGTFDPNALAVALSGQFTEVSATLLLLYALCVVVGFNQNVAWALIDRLVDTVLPSAASAGYTDVTDFTPSPTVSEPGGGTDSLSERAG